MIFPSLSLISFFLPKRLEALVAIPRKPFPVRTLLTRMTEQILMMIVMMAMIIMMVMMVILMIMMTKMSKEIRSPSGHTWKSLPCSYFSDLLLLHSCVIILLFYVAAAWLVIPLFQTDFMNLCSRVSRIILNEWAQKVQRIVQTKFLNHLRPNSAPLSLWTLTIEHRYSAVKYVINVF